LNSSETILNNQQSQMAKDLRAVTDAAHSIGSSEVPEQEIPFG